MNLYLEEIQALIQRAKEVEEELIELKMQKKRLELELFEIEAEITRQVYFDPALRNEQQRNAAIVMEKLRNARWKEITKDIMPGVTADGYAAFYTVRRLHEEIAARLGSNYVPERLRDE